MIGAGSTLMATHSYTRNAESPLGKEIYRLSRRYEGSRSQSVLVLACARLWLFRSIRDAHSRPQT